MKEIWRKLLSGLAARRIAELEAEATNLRQMFGDSIVPKHKRTRKHSKRKRAKRMSAKERKLISERMKAYWARRRKEGK